MSSIIDVKKVNTKLTAGEKAVEYIYDGMVVGLGTGTTTMFTIRKLGDRMRKEDMKIFGVPTSNEAEKIAKEAEIPVLPFNQVKEIDITIAGADEVDFSGNGIKGTKGALLLEKMVARMSKRTIWVVDETKLVSELGTVPLPVEVTADATEHVLNHINKNIANADVRKDENGERVTTSQGHHFIDVYLEKISEPKEIEELLKTIPGVVETGLFIDMVDTIIVGKSQGVEIINYDHR